jgi:TP901 family phage tail tape measure protein
MIGTAANFEQAMSKVKAITNSSNEDMQRLSATAQDLGAKTQFSASQAAEAMSYLGMAGWKTEQIIAGMPGLLDLAAASGSNLATVADIVSDDLTAFGMSADQAGHMADVMAAASTNANTNVEMMGQTFKYAGAVAGALGYDLEDVAVATGLMANAGIKADQAGTSLRSIMTRLAAPTKESGNAMDQLGISVVNADGTMKPFMQTMEELRDAFDGLSEAEKAEKAKMLGGQEAMSGLLAIINASDEDFAKLSDSITNCDGAAARMAGTMNDNAKGGAIQLQSAIEGVSIAIGQIFLPTLAQIAGGLASAVGGIAKWAQENQTLVSTIITAAGAVTGLVLAVLSINAAAAGISYLRASMALYKMVVTESTIATQLWAGVTKIAAAAQAAFNAVMSANPIALVVLAIVALIGAMTYLFKTNETFRNTVIAAWEEIKAAAMEVWNAIAPIVTAAWEGIKSAAQAGMEFLKGIWDSISPTVSAAFEMIVPIFSRIVNIVKTIIATGLRLWAAYIRTWIAVIGAVIRTVVSVVVTVWNAISTAVRTTIAVITAVVNTLIPIFSAVWTVIKTVAKVAFIALAIVALPILAGIAAAMLAVGAVIYVTWQAVKAVALAVWGAIGPYVMAVIDAIASFLVSAGEVIMSVWESIQAYATQVWDTISAVVSAVAEAIGSFITAAAAVVMAAWNAIYSAAVSAWNAIVDTVTSVWNTIQSVIDAGVASVTEKWERLKSIFSSPIQAVVNFVKGGDSDAASKSGVDISANAQGGIYRRGAFLTTFAEDSAEAAIPLDGSARAVSLWRQAGQMLGAMPGASASAVPVALPGGSSSSSVTIDFNPTINVSGNADAGVLPMIRAALAEQKAQFEKELPDMLNRVKLNQRRLSYE